MKEYIEPRKAASILGVTPKTLVNWEAEGKMVSNKTKGKHRRYDVDEVNRVLTLNKGIKALTQNIVQDAKRMEDKFLFNIEVDDRIELLQNFKTSINEKIEDLKSKKFKVKVVEV